MRCLMIDPCANILSSLLQCPTANLWGHKPLPPVCVLRLGHEHHTYTHTLTSTGQVMWPYFPIEPHSLDSTGHLLHTHKHTHSCKCVIWADASHTQSSRGVPLLYTEHILINLRYCAAFMRFKNGFRIFFKHLFHIVITKITGTVTFSTETLLLTFSRGETSPDLRFWHWKKNKKTTLRDSVCVVYYFITLIFMNGSVTALCWKQEQVWTGCRSQHDHSCVFNKPCWCFVCECVCVWTVAGQIQARKTHVMSWDEDPTKLFYTNKIPSVALIPKQLCNHAQP